MSRSLIARLQARHGRRVSLHERREFLKLTLGASAGLLLSSCSTLAPLGRDSRRRVVVAGAGFAGLACAHELRAAGYAVTVLEARPRLGGRVLSFNAANGNEYVPGRNVEGGAELIGSNHPAWVSYAELFGLQFLDVGEDEDADPPVVIDDRRLTAGDSAALWEELEAALERLDTDAADIPTEEPWTAAGAAELDRRSIQDFIDSLDASPLCKRAVWINQTADNGQDPRRQSYLGQLTAVKGGGVEKYWSESEVYRCAGGNDQLARRLAGAIGAENIRLGAPVLAIRADGDTLVVETGAEKLRCDDVVLAVPPTLWPSIRFSPALPAGLTPQMGWNAKHLAHVRGRFWENTRPAVSQYALADGLIQMTWDGTDGQKSGEAACLVGFAGGSAVQRALDMTKSAREDAFAQLYAKLFPGYADNAVATRYMDWPNDPWTRASYSFPAPGQVTTVGPLLAAAHLDDRLHLAGEHTCYKFVGYMEGALDSGIRIARRLAARDGIVSPSGR